MAGPYNPPNPYGSYFSFGEPENMARQTYGPMPFGMLHPAAMQSMGAGSGGFNPTPTEYLATRVRNQYQQQFMAEVMRGDPRVHSITSSLLSQMSASSQRSTLNLFGGRANFQEMVGFAMSQPGIASLVGGSPQALGQGALAATHGGMRLGGVGLFGDNAFSMMGAQQMVSSMTRQFYLQGGGANLAATSGLNRDQIGGIMALGAAQGAFAGLNIGELVTKGNQMSLRMDQGTMQKISQFTRTAAKALSSLIDVYGDASVAELAAKANQITGLNFNQLGNAQIIQNRLSSLRQTGVAMGVDTQTMFDLAAYSTQMGRNMGLNERFAGNVGTGGGISAMEIFRTNQSQAGSFRTATHSVQEIAAALVRDQMGMSMDPVGRRRIALQFGLESGNFTGEAATEARRLMREDGPGAAGRIDQFMASRGINSESYIRMMGGPQGMLGMLSEEGMDAIREANMSTVGDRARRVLRMQAFRTFGSRATGPGGEALMGAIEGLQKDTLDTIFQATRKGPVGSDELSRMIRGDVAGRVDPDKYVGFIQTAIAELGAEGAASMHANLQRAISANPHMKGFMTESGRMSVAMNRMGAVQFDDEVRGQMKPGLIEGFLDRLAGDDPRSMWMRAAMAYSGSVIGKEGGLMLPKPGGTLSDEQARTTVNTLISGMRTDAGREALRGLGITKSYDRMTAEERQAVMTNLSNPLMLSKHLSGYSMAQFGDRTMMLPTEVLRHESTWGGSRRVAERLSELVGDDTTRNNLKAVSDILKNDPTRAEQAAMRLANITQDLAVLKSVKPQELEDLAKISPMWATAHYQYLDQLSLSDKPIGDQNEIKRQKQILEKTGAAGMVSTLNGKLELVGNALMLVDGKMNTK